MTGLLGLPGLAAYSATKAGLSGLARAMSTDYARHGIRTNAVAPGTIDSDYRGDLTLMLCSESEEDWVDLHEGERIAQLLIIPCIAPEIAVVEQFSLLTERGEGGFGSTGR